MIMLNTIYTNWWTNLMVVVTILLFVLSFILKMHEWGIYPLREMTRMLRRPWFEAVLLIFFVGGLVQYGSTKGTNGTDRGELMGLMRSPAPTVVPIAADSTGFSIPTNFPSITNLCFWGIERGDEAVSLGIAWPPAMSFTNDCIDIFGCHRLTSNGWWRLAQLDVSQIGSNAIVELAYANLPTNAMQSSAFYRLASQDDSDGDGLTDKVEAWVLGTDPVSPDTDKDGLPDSDEIELDADPRSIDTDEDGICDGAEVGYIVKAPSFEWYDTTGWATTYGYQQDGGLHGYFSTFAMGTLSNNPNVLGIGLTGAMCFDNGSVYLYSPGRGSGWVFPEWVTPLNENHYDMGDIMVAPYWCGSSLLYGDQTSYMRTGIVASNNCFVVEYHNVKLSWSSNERMTYQVIVPGGTGNVIRVSYYSSDIWIDGANAVVGVQNKRITTTNGCYNLTWNFSERGPILPQTTIEYHLGYGTNPASVDTDGDGLDDTFEISVFHSDPLSADGDGDGLPDIQEYVIGTNPKAADSDGDYLPDKWEHDNGLNPLSATGSDGWAGDPDGDGLNNWQEKTLGTLPNNADSDADGLNDGLEVSIGTNPLLADSDYDGISDSQERTIGTSPTQPDTDGDGMNDGWELTYSGMLLTAGNGNSTTTFNPLVHNSNDSDPNNDYSADPDGDGLTNGQESDMGTNPNIADTDGDGANDGDEVAQSSDPNDETDLGVAHSRVALSFYFGDHSGSHSEKYCLRLTPVAGSGIGTAPRTLSYVNANYGECETKAVVLVPGWKYEISLHHAGTNLESGPDYDYTLMPTGSVPANVTIEDGDSLLGVDDTSTAFSGAGKSASISIHAVTQVAVCSPDDSSWNELEEGRVILDNESLRVKVVVSPQLATLDRFRQMFGNTLTVKTAGTCPNGVQVPIGSDAIIDGLSGEIRITKTRQQLIACGLLPSQNEDGVEEMASYDVGTLAGSGGSNLSDCLAFEQMALAHRGRASNEQTTTLDSNPPNSELSESFFKAAGAEVLTVAYGGVRSAKRQIMNQADYFYYSGHGEHKRGKVDEFEPTVISDHWKKDLNCVIFAGCSILDINDYNCNFLNPEGEWDPKNHDASPGKLWEVKGPSVLLGYNYRAPLDSTHAPERIVRSWINLRQTMGDVDAWMSANDNMNGRNACVIVKDVKYVYFKRTRHKFFSQRFSTYEIVEVRKENW